MIQGSHPSRIRPKAAQNTPRPEGTDERKTQGSPVSSSRTAAKNSTDAYSPSDRLPSTDSCR